jgi:hypothetical protein
VREQDSSLRSLSLKEFAVAVFDNCPELAQHVVRCVRVPRWLGLVVGSSCVAPLLHHAAVLTLPQPPPTHHPATPSKLK